MYYQLVELLNQGLFNGLYPNSLAQYLVEIFALVAICSLLFIPFFIIYAIVRRFL